LHLTQEDGSWFVELGWGQNRAVLSFDGLFAERRARIAVLALQRIVQAPVAITEKPKARAAGA
jgi:hypothetical protein